MHLPDQYLKDLEATISLHRQAHAAGSILQIITDAKTQDYTFDKLHWEIRKVLSQYNANNPKWNECWTHAFNHQQDLNEALILAMNNYESLQPGSAPVNQAIVQLNPQESTFYTTAYFNQKLFQVHVDYTSKVLAYPDVSIGSLIRNALPRLVAHHKLHSKNYTEAKTNLAKSYHAKRLLILQDWISDIGYKAYIKSVLSFHKGVTSQKLNLGLSLSLNLDDKNERIEILKDQQHLLNWLAIICEKYSAAESPFAMSTILKFFELLQYPRDKDNTKLLVDLIQQLQDYFISEECVTQIYLGSAIRSSLEINMKLFFKAKEDPKQLEQAISILIPDLLAAYEELATFFVDTTQLLIQLNLLLNGDDPKTNEIFMKLANDAIDFYDLAKTTKSLAHGVVYYTNGFFFTQLNKEVEEVPTRRTSRRSSDKQKIGSPLLSARSPSVYSFLNSSTHENLKDLSGSSVKGSSSRDTLTSGGTSNRVLSDSDIKSLN